MSFATASAWHSIQATITWAEQQPTVQRNTKEACLAKQARLLRSMANKAVSKNG